MNHAHLVSLKGTYRDWLLGLAEQVQVQLERSVSDPRLRMIRPVKHRQSDTYGWLVSVAKLKGDRRGRFELWVDLMPNIGRPILSVCYESHYAATIEAAARIAPPSRTLGKRELGKRSKSGDQVLALPLPRAAFGKTLAEYYEWSFLTIYLSDSVVPSRPASRALRDKVASQLVMLIHTVAASMPLSEEPEDFPAIENKGLVTTHLNRERNARLALHAKQRDQFTCQVCGLNFADTYGDIGRGFAEAHHKRPLGELRRPVKSTVDDLVTVCANCHRMLHRMKGGPRDITRLRNTFAASKAAKKRGRS